MGDCGVAFSCCRVPLPGFPWPIQNRLRNAQSLQRLSGEFRPKRRSGRAGEPVTVLSPLGVLACVLGFCLHGLVSVASIVQLPAALPQLLAT